MSSSFKIKPAALKPAVLPARAALVLSLLLPVTGAVALAAAPAVHALAVHSQDAAPAAAPARFVGTVTAASGTTLTVKTDAGQSYQVDVPSAASIKRVAPGQKDLSTAETIQFSDLAVGDRALVRLDPNAAAGTTTALQIIAIKQSDVTDKQEKDREDWQRNGVGGLVKTVDPSAGVITVASGAGTASKVITVKTTKATVLKRYAPASVSYDSAKPAPMDAIHPGDQLRARGVKAADGSSIDAVEVVSGTFRNISGVISAVDPSANTIALKDLATKKQITIHITPEAQMRKLPERMATALAARLKGGGSARSAGARQGGERAAGAPAGSPSGGGQYPAGAGGPGMAGGQGMAGGREGGNDPQQILSRAPAIKIGDLQKGDAVMLVATDGATDVTAITLVAGVEPLLEAPEASSLLSNWSMGGGGGGAEAAAQ